MKHLVELGHPACDWLVSELVPHSPRNDVVQLQVSAEVWAFLLRVRDVGRLEELDEGLPGVSHCALLD